MYPEKVLSLRPHHALCLLLFCAVGHSERYASKMRQLIGAMEQGKIQTIRMIEELDEICGYCPHNQGGFCEKADEVSVSDAKILALCGMTVGESLSWIELRQRLISHIVSQSVLADVCAGCVYLKRCAGQGTKREFAIG